MPKILIVDDNPVDRQLASRLLEKNSDALSLGGPGGLQILVAADGQEAFAVAQRDKPDLIVTDLNMPVRDGLGLVEDIKLKLPQIPVILMTAQGSEEVAMRSLQRGAAYYVPKRLLAQDLVDAVISVLESSQATQGHKRVLDCMVQSEVHFLLENDAALIPPLVNYLKESRFRIGGSDETGLVRVTIALREAVLNAMHHGNLELSSQLRETNDKEYYRLGQERRRQKPYSDRKVFVTALDTPDESIYIIRDEGPGFDPAKLPDPLDPENMDRVSGRGLLLIRTFMDEVRHNPAGNEITVIKRSGDT
ncbi:MAG TPA: response regulator [Gemmataceae bacterium]|jgi:CheY-like chemotaxis protein/anti-sigma regulatory factor (Ser/Thr protein kinase)|nr:response regulator [Gemmataceae bacterium]